MTLCAFSVETIERAFDLRTEGRTWKEIAMELGGTWSGWRSIIQRRFHHRQVSISWLEQEMYKAGRYARLKHKSKSACPCSPMVNLGSWWLAGWNDKDIELGGFAYETHP